MLTKENVITAKFVNEEHTTIEVLYTTKDDDNAHVYVFEYDKDRDEMKQLEKAGWDLERITEETEGYKREASRIHNESIQAAADEILKEDRKAIKEEWDKLKEEWTKSDLSWKQVDEALGKAEVKRQDAVTDIIGTIIANNEDEDMLFKAKLAAMELDIVKKSKNTKIKQEIRKAKSLMEVISTLYKL